MRDMGDMSSPPNLKDAKKSSSKKLSPKPMPSLFSKQIESYNYLTVAYHEEEDIYFDNEH